MTIRLFEPRDVPSIHELLATNHWEYFLDTRINDEGLHNRDASFFTKPENLTFVCCNENENLLGFIHFTEVAPGKTPDFVLYVDNEARGKGVGTALLRFSIEYIFRTYPTIRRIYATTREDNIAMQKTFDALGFKKEAHHRREWENRESGVYMDSFGYALLREEWGA